MKQFYQKPMVSIEFFDLHDVITASPSAYDGTGFIPDSWWHV